MPNLSQIRAFIAVCENLSFTKAAIELNVTTASVSKSISTLEKQLKIDLIRKKTKSLELTEEGKIYYTNCLKFITKFEEANHSILKTKSDIKGEIRLKCRASYYKYYLYPFIKEFLEKYKNITLTVNLHKELPRFDREELENYDISIDLSSFVCHGTNPGKKLDHIVNEEIMQVESVLCASPDFKEQHKIQSPSDLENLSYIVSEDCECPSLKFDNKKVMITPSLRSNCTFMRKKAVADGMGFGIFLDYEVKKTIEEGSLIDILPKYRKKRSLYLRYQKHHYVSPKIKAFIDFFREKGLMIENRKN